MTKPIAIASARVGETEAVLHKLGDNLRVTITSGDTDRKRVVSVHEDIGGACALACARADKAAISGQETVQVISQLESDYYEHVLAHQGEDAA